MAIMGIPKRMPLQWAFTAVLLLLGGAGMYYIGVNGGFDVLCEQWALMVVVLLLACAGIYHIYTLLRGYRCLPLETTACEGGEPHYLVYVNEYEKGQLSIIAKHTGPPPKCLGIDSYAPKYSKNQGKAYMTWGPDPRTMQGGQPGQGRNRGSNY